MKHLAKYSIRVIIFLMLTLFSFNSKGQTDTIIAKKPIMTAHSPRKATILSAILPGAGQVYNKKYWKVPLVYAAIGGCLYVALDNNKEYKKYFKELAYRSNNPGFTSNSELAIFSDANLSEQADYHRKWRDNFYVFTAVAYGLNIIDANVDANLFNFDVSNDLTLNISPYTDYSLALQAPVGGLSLKFNFK